MGTDARHDRPRRPGEPGQEARSEQDGGGAPQKRSLATLKPPKQLLRRSAAPAPATHRPHRAASALSARPDCAAAPVHAGPLATRQRVARLAGRRPTRTIRTIRVWALVLATLTAFAVGVAPSLARSAASSASFDGAGSLEGVVGSDGGALVLDGRPFQAVGFNDYRLTASPGGYVCDTSYGEVTDAELGERLDRAAAAGASVIRTWFFQSAWDADGDGSGDFGPFDRVLEAAAERGLRVVPVIANHWGDCEAGGRTKELDFYAGGFREPSAGEALSYLDYAGELASRYAGSPAIAYWQLVNEPEASSAGGCDEAAAAGALAGFASEAAEAVRARDPEHLISLGTIGGGQCGTAGEHYLAAHAAVDVCEIHVYDGPETGTSPTTPLPGDATNGAAARISACEAAGKPIVAGELGYAADLDSGGNPTGAVSAETLANRARFLSERVEAMREIGLDGFLVWQLDSRTPLSAGADTYAVGPCDPIEGVVAEAGAGSGDQPIGGCA